MHTDLRRWNVGISSQVRHTLPSLALESRLRFYGGAFGVLGTSRVEELC
jgi:hypothetical protein